MSNQEYIHQAEHRISVVINTYNASQHLAEVLETVKDFDEVVICDMESTDNTSRTWRIRGLGFNYQHSWQ